MRIGEEISGYEVIAPLGEGAMGEVFRGKDIRLDRDVAIKVLKPEISSRKDLVERFKNEALTMAKLNHGNICSVYAFLTHGNEHLMVLQFVNGVTLEAEIRDKKIIPQQKVFKILNDVLSGLIEAHQSGVIHRDLKPANLMMTPSGKVVIMDFGIARMANQARTTRTGMMIGTIEYASPEQLRGEDLDARSDLYSLGILTYELLMGKLPFDAKTDFEWIQAHIKQKISVEEIKENFGTDLANFIARATEKDANKRFQTASDMLAELTRIKVISTGAVTHYSTNIVDNIKSAFGRVTSNGATSISQSEHIESFKNNIGFYLSGVLILVGVGFGIFTLIQKKNEKHISVSPAPVSPNVTEQFIQNRDLTTINEQPSQSRELNTIATQPNTSTATLSPMPRREVSNDAVNHNDDVSSSAESVLEQRKPARSMPQSQPNEQKPQVIRNEPAHQVDNELQQKKRQLMRELGIN
ncbi:MAG: serine/threonine protein kinase [Nitrosomonas sp.]|nr:serine/threonine protein kinase [Nitrosomonas sp.]